MKQVYKDIALQVGGSFYPEVGGDLLEKFGDAVVTRCIEALLKGDYRMSTYTTFDKGNNPKVIENCVENIKQAFN